MTFQIRLAVLRSTREGLLMVRETVAVETRARRATSWIFITGRRGPIPGTRFTASKWYLLGIPFTQPLPLAPAWWGGPPWTARTPPSRCRTRRHGPPHGRGRPQDTTSLATSG